MLLPSREVRWFLPSTSALSELLVEWIEHRDPYDPDGTWLDEGIWKGKLEDRADLYAVVPGAVDMGVKWREGELQIKGCVQQIGTQMFGAHIGKVEQWLKWSYKGPTVDRAFGPLFHAPRNGGPTIVTVNKRRALRKIAVDGRGALCEVSGGAFPERAVNVELTELEVGRERYWSLGVEAFPDDSNIPAAFFAVAQSFLQQLEGVTLSEDNCFSYPGWLHAGATE